MTRTSIESFFGAMENSYKVGDYSALADAYAYPSAVYIGDEVIVIENEVVLQKLLKDQCRRNHEMGVRYVNNRVVAQSHSRMNNYSVWLMWNHFSGNGALLSTTNARYICIDDVAGMPKIQLVEFLDVPECYTNADLEQIVTPRRQTS